MAKKLLLGSDGLLHLRTHNCATQEIRMPIPLNRVLTMRCLECGTANEYEHSWNSYRKTRDAELLLEQNSVTPTACSEDHESWAKLWPYCPGCGAHISAVSVSD